MKKIILVLLSVMMIACTPKKQDPHEVLNDTIKENYPLSDILYEKNEDSFYFGLLKEKKEIILIILEKTEDGYHYFGKSSYESQDDYGKYFYKDDNYSMVVIFSENKNKYSQMTLEYSNETDDNETLRLDYTNNEKYILKLFVLLPQYELMNVTLK